MAGARDGINILSNALQQNEHVIWYKFIIKFIFDCAFAIVLPILRHNLGERFFSLPVIAVMGVVMFLAGNRFGLTSTEINIYLAVLGLLSLFHWLIILLRNKRGEQWHTRYEGDYLPFFKFLPYAKNEWVIEGFYEPLLIVISAIVVSNFGMAFFANFLLLIAVLMIIRVIFNYSLYKERLLDDRDAMIEAQHAMDAINGVPSKESKGFVIKGAKSLDTNDRKSIGRRRLSEETFNQHFPDVADITMSREEMRQAT